MRERAKYKRRRRGCVDAVDAAKGICSGWVGAGESVVTHQLRTKGGIIGRGATVKETLFYGWLCRSWREKVTSQASSPLYR